MNAPRRPAPASSIRALLAGMMPPRALEVSSLPVSPAATVLRTERMALRPLAADDHAEFLRVLRLNRTHLARFFPLRTGRETDSDIFARHVRLSGFDGPGGPDWRRVAFDHAGRMIGEFNLNAIRRGLEFRAEATWWVSREFAGRGYATEGVAALLEFAFRDIAAGGLGLHRVDALICPENAPSRRIVEKLGFLTPAAPLRVSLDMGPAGGGWKVHELYRRYVEMPACEIEAKPLPARLLERIGTQLRALENADPDEAALLGVTA